MLGRPCRLWKFKSSETAGMRDEPTDGGIHSTSGGRKKTKTNLKFEFEANWGEWGVGGDTLLGLHLGGSSQMENKALLLASSNNLMGRRT